MSFQTFCVLLAVFTAVCAQAPTNKYELKDANNATCLKADMSLSIKVDYTKTDNATAPFTWPLDGTVTVGGNCANDSTTTALLTLSIPAAETSVSMTFTKDGDSTFLSGVVLSYKEDPDIFNETANPNKTNDVNKGELKEFEASPGNSYKCNNQGDLDLGSGAMLILADVQVQAFDVKNSTFGDTLWLGRFYDECAADLPTTMAPNTTVNPNTTVSPNTTTPANHTTIMPTTTPEPKPTPNPDVPDPKQHNYTVTNGDGKICLMALMALQVDANYTKKDGKIGVAKWNVPENTTVGGDCGNDTSVLEVTYDGGESKISITFTKSGKSNMLQEDGKFKASMITVEYVETEAHFPETNNTGTKHTVTNNNLTAFEGSVGSSYKCMAEQDVMLSGDVTLVAKDIQLQPFGLSSDNFDTAEECPADNEISNIVPIAVGCALAGLVVIVLIAYLIGRRKSHKGYQQV